MSAGKEKELKLAIGRGPVCPHCALDTFDDWRHGDNLRTGIGIVSIEGSIKCHGCGKFFSVTQYHDGETHCSAMARKSAPQAQGGRT